MLRIARSVHARLSRESKEDLFFACNRMFREANTKEEVFRMQVAFLSGVLPGSIDHCGPPQEETDEIAADLITMCHAGYLPTCSQPPRANQIPYVMGMVEAGRATTLFEAILPDDRFWVCAEMPDGTVRTNAPFNEGGFYTVSRRPDGTTTHCSRTGNRELFFLAYEDSPVRDMFADHACVWVAAREEDSPASPAQTILAALHSP